MTLHKLALGVEMLAGVAAEQFPLLTLVTFTSDAVPVVAVLPMALSGSVPAVASGGPAQRRAA